jgi:Na+-translocating ferredoxin:NAD+ oxidoreductase RNF subunit RnfB
LNVWITLLTASIAMGALTALLATLLVLAHRWLQVADDPRIAAVQSMLPQTNCGGCGFPGCRAFAEALVAGETMPSRCGVSSLADHQRIASYLGIGVGSDARRVARLACAGGDNVSVHHAQYVGAPTCASATIVSGGGKGCFWGCLGLGDCCRACKFDAISMDAHHLPIVAEDLCTACGDCVVACPKDLFSLQPLENRLWVACKSEAAGDEILAECQVACTACGRCAADSDGVITMRNNLPVIDTSHQPLDRTPSLRCPTGAIFWIDPKIGPMRGPAAVKVFRETPLRDAPT